MVPQQELRVLGGEKRMAALATSQWGLKAPSNHPASPFVATFLATNLLVQVQYHAIFPTFSLGAEKLVI